jgi:sensitive to high expression protein 9
MPPPASDTKPAPEDAVEERARRLLSSLKSQEPRQEHPSAIPNEQASEGGQQQDTPKGDAVAAGEAQQGSHEEPASSTPKSEVADTITRVPDEQLPSHRERQRWDLSKRLSKLMDEVLPKLAAVTQKVNHYTGTDYSGVAALRREIKEQGRTHALTVRPCHD